MALRKNDEPGPPGHSEAVPAGGFDLTTPSEGELGVTRVEGGLVRVESPSDDQWHAGEETSPTAALLRAVTFLVAGRGVLTLGLALATGRKLSSAFRSFFSTDTVRQASFFGSFSFLYIAVRRFLTTRQSAFGTVVSKSWVAGSVAGITIALDDPGRAHALATYMLSRAAALVCHAGVRKEWWPALRWFPAAVFMLSEVSEGCSSGRRRRGG
jgi:hypothetical protein